MIFRQICVFWTRDIAPGKKKRFCIPISVCAVSYTHLDVYKRQLNEPADLVNQAAEWGQPAVAITDHGVVQAFPDAAKAAKKLKDKGKEIKIIYGLEGYVLDDEGLIDEDGNIDYKSRPTNHIILLAATQEGLKNIYKLVSYSCLLYTSYLTVYAFSTENWKRSAEEVGGIFGLLVKYVASELKELNRCV